MNRALKALAAMALAPGLFAQVARVSLEADLEIEAAAHSKSGVDVHFRFGAPYDVQRAVARVSITPPARIMKGRAVWRGAVPANTKRLQKVQYRLQRSTEYTIVATFQSLHTRTGELVTGTERTQKVRLGPKGIELLP